MAVHQHDESLPMTLGLMARCRRFISRRVPGSSAGMPTDEPPCTRLDVTDGTESGSVSGPRPWTREGAALARRLAPEM